MVISIAKQGEKKAYPVTVKPTTAQIDMSLLQDESGNPKVFENSDAAREYLLGLGYEMSTAGYTIKGFIFDPIIPFTKQMDMPNEAIAELAGAVVRQAIIDYVVGKDGGSPCPSDRESSFEITGRAKNAERFFLSDEFDLFSDLDGKTILKKLDAIDPSAAKNLHVTTKEGKVYGY